MNPAVRQRVLRMNAVFLGGFGILGLLLLDVPAACCAVGAGASTIRNAPYSVIGLVEAHGLAIVIAALFLHASRAIPGGSWHAAATFVHTLLGTANVMFWGIFVTGDVVWLGWLVTPLHFAFALAEAAAAIAVRRRPAATYL
ncbi:hypothetical protein [Mycobacterium sp. 852002-30065_SCH5024008]|uniref:hypothetical protein n=1 Tax=Mycobacterium sp. 852002-30065_SCH5024008 TaxID=1834088 RepID=UPI000A9B0622|nr:hypothetical protein [Mycobacterium sp. 852002-30065_SCH5024008]